MIGSFLRRVSKISDPNLPFTIQKINFDKSLLCPQDIVGEDLVSWIEEYVNQFPAGTIIAWSDDTYRLHIAFGGHKQVSHLSTEYSVPPGAYQIFSPHGEYATFKIDVKGRNANTMFFPSLESLQGVKLAVYLNKCKAINFNPRILCPENLSFEETRNFVEFYLQKLPPKNIFLWCHPAKHLIISYSVDGNCFHYEIFTHTVEGPNNDITNKNGLPLSMVVPKAMKVLGSNFNIPLPEQLLALKFDIFLNKKIVTPEMVEKSLNRKRTVVANLSSCQSCVICMDDYTAEAPPFLVTSSGQIYHSQCLTDFVKARNGAEVRDPLTNLRILTSAQASVCIRENSISSFVAKDVTYLSLLGNLKDVVDNLEEICKEVEILSLENRELKNRLAMVAQNLPGPPLANPPANDQGIPRSLPSPRSRQV